MSKLPPSETPIKDFCMEQLWKMHRANKQRTIAQTIPYHVLRTIPASPQGSSSSTSRTANLEVNDSDDDFVNVTPSKSRRKLSTSKSSEPKKSKVDL